MAPRRGETFQQFVDIASSASLCPDVKQIYDEVVWNLHLQVSFLRFPLCSVFLFFTLLVYLYLTQIFNSKSRRI